MKVKREIILRWVCGKCGKAVEGCILAHLDPLALGQISSGKPAGIKISGAIPGKEFWEHPCNQV